MVLLVVYSWLGMLKAAQASEHPHEEACEPKYSEL